MAHYYDSNPEAPHDLRQIEVRIGGVDLVFGTDSAVFSRAKLDFGTRLLIEAALDDIKQQDQAPHGRMLDLGCGYGAVGIVFKRVYPALEVVMTDINDRAVRLARKNATANKIKYADIRVGDGFAAVGPKEVFDYILTNPPIRAGKKTVYAFFDGAFAHLAPGGRFYTVVQNKQGAPSAKKHLQSIFGNCVDIDRQGGYHVYRCIRDPQVAANIDML